jgi:mono/diheme cytochrome c family protein
MRSVYAACRRLLAVALCGAGFAAITSLTTSVANGQTKAAPSVLKGAYTEEQAIRGQALYYAQCLSCHGEDMAGLDQAPPLAGPVFSGVWEGESLWALVQRIDMMPPTQPGTLSRDDAVAILAYMLWYNGLPIGDAPLSTEQRVLAEMTFHAPPLPGQ